MGVLLVLQRKRRQNPQATTTFPASTTFPPATRSAGASVRTVMIFLRLGCLLLLIGAVLAGDAEQSAADQQQQQGGGQEELSEQSSDMETKDNGGGENKVFPSQHYHTQQQGYPLDAIPIPVHQIPIQSGHILLPQLFNNGLQQGAIHLPQWESNKLQKPPQPVFDHQHQSAQQQQHESQYQQQQQQQQQPQQQHEPQYQHQHQQQQQPQQGHHHHHAYPDVHHQPTQVVHHGGGGASEEQHHQYIENHNVHPQQSTDLATQAQGQEPWPLPQPEMPKIVHLDVKCEKNLMKVVVEFDKPFHGIIFSKGHYSYGSCVHLPAGSGRKSVYFDVSINSCGTIGNTQNGLYGYDGGNSGTGSFFENTIIVQYDPQVQEVWDQARKLRCTWHNNYEKAVTFRPFPVDMLDVVRADFAGDNVGCWMQIQAGKGPWASEVAGIVKIGQTMTMVLAIKDDENKFDMLVRNCIAHDGQRAPIELVDSQGCVVRPKLMSRFTKIRNFGSSATVLSYAHFQAFKFPDTMEVHFQCTIQICRYQCPDQCSAQASVDSSASDKQALYSNHVSQSAGRPREERDVSYQEEEEEMAEIGVNRVIRVVSAGDLAFSLGSNETHPAPLVKEEHESSIICMSAPGFASVLVVLLSLLVIACLLSAFLWIKQKTASRLPKSLPYDLPVLKKGKL
ncbi:hypothetical protein V5799_020784 [Amblyomma americanum]|uniref:ZP domain-containing protein n=1 Tax=Amblyomma americanum TaxID=6943 RepID=A0AAQ4ETQ9_AMBAM